MGITLKQHVIVIIDNTKECLHYVKHPDGDASKTKTEIIRIYLHLEWLNVLLRELLLFLGAVLIEGFHYTNTTTVTSLQWSIVLG